jgi:hypothetical protein
VAALHQSYDSAEGCQAKVHGAVTRKSRLALVTPHPLSHTRVCEKNAKERLAIWPGVASQGVQDIPEKWWAREVIAHRLPPPEHAEPGPRLITPRAERPQSAELAVIDMAGSRTSRRARRERALHLSAPCSSFILDFAGRPQGPAEDTTGVRHRSRAGRAAVSPPERVGTRAPPVRHAVLTEVPRGQLARTRGRHRSRGRPPHPGDTATAGSMSLRATNREPSRRLRAS